MKRAGYVCQKQRASPAFAAFKPHICLILFLVELAANKSPRHLLGSFKRCGTRLHGWCWKWEDTLQPGSGAVHTRTKMDRYTQRSEQNCTGQNGTKRVFLEIWGGET